MNIEKILDSLVGAKARPTNQGENEAKPRSFIEEALSAFGLGENASSGSRNGVNPAKVVMNLLSTRDVLGGDYNRLS